MREAPAQRADVHVAIDCLVVAAKPSGVERTVTGLLEGLAEARPRGMRFSLLAAQGAEDLLPVAPGMSVLSAPAWAQGRVGRVLYEQTVAAARVRASGADVLHGPASVLPLDWDGRSVVTVHDAITLCHPEWCQWHNVVHYRLVMTRSAERADAVIVQSQWTKREVVEQLGIEAARVHVCPLGVGAQFRPAETAEVERVRARHGLPQRYLLCVGNVEPRKNLEAVIAAFELIAGDVPHALVIAGKRGWKCDAICQAMQDSPQAARIHWLDWVAQEELAALYTGADLLVQFSLHEGFGLTPLEAMVCGTAAVISDAGALPEVAGEAAEVVALEAGVEGLAETLRRLLSDDEARAALAREGPAYAAQYTWERHARGVLAVYAEVAGA